MNSLIQECKKICESNHKNYETEAKQFIEDAISKGFTIAQINTNLVANYMKPLNHKERKFTDTCLY